MKRPVLILVLSSLAATSAPAAAFEAGKDCLNQKEAFAFSEFLLSTVAPIVADQCSTAHAGASPAIVAAQTELRTRFKARGDAAWPVVLEHFLQQQEDKAVAAEMRKQSEAMRPMVANVTASAIVKDMSAKDCATANDLVDALLPLQDAQIARLMTVFMRIGAGQSPTGLQLCPLGVKE